MKRSTILSLVGVAVIMLIIGTTLGSVAFPKVKIEATTLTSVTTTTSSWNNVTVLIPIVATSKTTTTISVATVTITTYSLFVSGNKLLNNYGNIFGNSSITVDCNNSYFTFPQLYGTTMNLTVNGDMNMISAGSGQLNLVINGNSNQIYTFNNQTAVLSERINGTGNNVAYQSPLP